MSKRLHEELEEDGKAEEKPVKKHTLDSDEEDEIDHKKYNLMDPDEIEGEEDGTIAKDGDIQITPFNMKEEMTEGHFDAEGNYYWKKEVQIRDAWLDNIDDTKQHYDARDNDGDSDSDASDGPSESMKASDKAACYEQMLGLMQPRETVAKALRRLGGNKSRHSASARWRQRRAGAEAQSETAAADRQQMEQLTGLADRLLSDGNMEVYQLTREAVSHQLELLRQPVSDRLQGATEDDALDMFADSLDQQPGAAAAAGGDARPTAAGPPSSDGEPQTAAAQPQSKEQNSEQTETAEAAAEDAGDAVTWEFKWDDSDDAEVHGPHSSSEMHAWSESGYFSDAVRVRKTGSTAFYQVKRVDFEIYM